MLMERNCSKCYMICSVFQLGKLNLIPGCLLWELFSRVIRLSSRTFLALSTVAQNWVICITSCPKTCFVGAESCFVADLMQFKRLLLLGNMLSANRDVTLLYFLSFHDGTRTCHRLEREVSAWCLFG